MEGIMRCSANYMPLTPISFLERSATAHGDRISIIYGSMKFTWEETRDRCRRIASALNRLGISRGDVVGAMGPGVPAMYELHYGVAMAGGIICAMRNECDERELSDMIVRSKAKIIFVDHEHLEVASRAMDILDVDSSDGVAAAVRLIPIFEPDGVASDDSEWEWDYERLLRSGDPEHVTIWPADECDPISISFTSGTTGVPKGVVHRHRAGYLNALATVILMEMRVNPVFLLTMPIYHCNGWSFVWATALLCGTTVCFREITPKAVFSAIVDHGATDLAGTTPVMTMLANASDEDKQPLPRKVNVLLGGSPLPPAVLLKMEALGFQMTHAFGQTETYCCATFCSWKPEWDLLPPEERGKLKSRQGVLHHLMSEVDVKHPVSMEAIPADGETVGEVVYRGNNVMCGYLDPAMTAHAFRGGWFHSGDLAVKHPDGYIEVKDRLVDLVVTSGGKCVGTVEVENLIFEHPAVLQAGVVGGRFDGTSREEVLTAFVKLKDGVSLHEEDILGFCRARLPEHKLPRYVVFDDLPITPTGKLRKAVLREKARAMDEAAQVARP